MGSAQDVTYVVQCVTLLCKGIIFYAVFSGLELCIKHSSLLLGQCLCLVGCGWAVELCQVFKCYSRNSYFVELVEKHNQEGQDVWLHYEKLLECKLLTWAFCLIYWCFSLLFIFVPLWLYHAWVMSTNEVLDFCGVHTTLLLFSYERRTYSPSN